MKVIIPLAGKGTRLRPHTHVIPKPLIKIAGKPMMAYILEKLERLGTVEQIIYITGHLKEKVEEYVRENWQLPAVFVEQVVQDGTAGAVALARPYVDQPVLIVFADTIFDADLSVIDRIDADGIIWVKEVEDYQRFGVVVTDGSGHMTRIVEKPDTPVSRRANIGLHYVRNWQLLFEGIDWVRSQPRYKGEYYLTDAFQYMIDHGARIAVVDVDAWYDAGKVETVLETNRAMLEHGHARRPATLDAATIVEPVYIEEGVDVVDSVIGPNVSIGGGTVIRSSRLRDTIVGSGARIVDCDLHDSLIGDEALVQRVRGRMTVADHSEIVGD